MAAEQTAIREDGRLRRTVSTADERADLVARFDVTAALPATARAVSIVGSRTSGIYATAVAAAVVEAAALTGASIWMRASPSGAEAAALAAATDAGVPVVAVCAGPLDALPSEFTDHIARTGGAVCSTATAEVPDMTRDELVALASGVLVAVDGTQKDAPDVMHAISTAVCAGSALVVARPRSGHRRGPTAQLAMCASDPRRVGRLGLSPAAVAKLSRAERPAHAVCDSPEEIVAALDLLIRFDAAAVHRHDPDRNAATRSRDGGWVANSLLNGSDPDSGSVM